MIAYLYRGALFALLAATTHAADITLLNGLVLTGEVIDASAQGLEFSSAGRTRVYPWYSLAPGSRFRYDPVYRVNLNAYLTGAESSTFTNAPDPEYRPGEPPTPSASQPTPASSGNFFLQFPHLDPVDLRASRAWRDNELAENQFLALQLGPKPGDRVVYAFPLKPPAALFFQTPDAIRATRIEPATTGAASNIVFKTQAFNVSAGENNITLALTWRQESDSYQLLAEVEHNNIKYRLAGRPARLSPGASPLFAFPLLQPPALDFKRIAQDGATRLSGRIRMGALTFHPGEGLANEVNVELIDASGRRMLEQPIEHQTDGAGDFTLTLPLDGITTGDRFTLRASAELGTILGRVEVDQVFHIQR